jgi:hypothetical protein
MKFLLISSIITILCAALLWCIRTAEDDPEETVLTEE